MATMGCVVSFNAVVTYLTTFILTPAVFALPPLPTVEHHRRTPVLTIMAIAFSPFEITGYTILAIVTSYSFVRLYHFLKSRLTSAARVALPQPVSAGRTSSYSLYSPFTLLRSRQRVVSTKSIPTRSRWSPLSAFLRRLSRRSTSPLHLSDAEHLLPTTMPDSPSAHTHSLIELPIIPNSSSGIPTTAGRSRSLSFGIPARQLTKASSMEALTVYRPLTPVPVMVPIPVHITSSSPSTPRNPITHSSNDMSDSDIPLIPITSPKRHYTPTPDFPTNLPTLPLNGNFPGIIPSPPSEPSTVTVASTTRSGWSRATSPSPTRGIHNNGLFLSSRNLSSLSLFPQSAHSMHKRSKSLGGVAVKKISPPQFNFDGIVSQGEDLREDVEGGANNEKLRALSAPVFVAADKKVANADRWTPRSELPLSSPLTTDSDSPPSSAPLETPRSISNTSYSDIAKPSEKKPLSPNSIPLVDIDMNANRENMDMDNVMSSCEYGLSRKNAVNGWSFDVEEPVTVAHVLRDFDDDVAGVVVDVAKAPAVGIAAKVGREGSVELEGAPGESVIERPRADTWRWDEDVEGQENGWDIEGEEQDERMFKGLPMEDAVPDDVEESSDAVVSLETVEKFDHGIKVEAETELERAVEEYPNHDLLLLPETTDIVPPAISIRTQDIVPCRNESSEYDSVLSSAIERATPVSLGQTPTPPASPPREAKNLPKISKSLQDQTLNAALVASPVAKTPAFASMDVETQEDEIDLSVVDQEAEVGNTLYTIDVMPPQIDLLGGAVEAVEAIVFLDKPLVSSPASISSGLPEVDEVCDEITIKIECDGDGSQIRSDGEFEVQIIPPSPCGRITAWCYGSEDEEELEGEVQLEQEAGDQDRGCRRELEQEVQRKEDDVLVPMPFVDGGGQDCVENEGERSVCEVKAPCMADIQASEEGTLSDRLALTTSDTEVSAEPAPSSVPEALGKGSISVTPEIAVVSASTSVQSSASLPGTFPGTATSPIHETEVATKPVQNGNTLLSSQPQIRKRTRTPLEEAIARTRSPLEVALAMQLRPGLGSSADPAWMVRFMMVMWGWVFGLALTPSAPA